MKTGIFFGSTTGTCENLAGRIAEAMGVDSSDVHNASELTADLAGQYDRLILGSSTWGCGDLQDDWYDSLETLKGMDLSGKQVGLFACGDAGSYGDTFCNAMGTMYDDLQGTGATFIGTGVSTDGYSFDDSTAVRDGAWVGLALDEVNEDDQTDERIKNWVASL
ncbi:MAG: flavodoxin FldA [Bacteroidaceae bacterium]|nr:flavodoxin FldA [Bacteroidaceae bacterium]